ncbi:MAG: DnaB-like helicase N-terminal domain-containing protein, partial [Thiomicrorhabdus sp.]|nr:DnaB-like helicase N-terminal domain-containing protein [Thiomicrorhabdus sp.]
MAQRNSTKNTAEELFKVPPHSIEAEQSVLGGLMLSDDVLDDVSVIVNASDFYTKQHQVIFDAIFELNRNNKPFDLVSVVAYLGNTGQLETAGDKAYLAELVKNTPGSANILYYSQLVRDKSILRKLIQASNEVSEAAYFPQGKDIREILDIAEAKIMGIAEHGEGKERLYKSMDMLLESAINKIDELFNSEGTITGQETHLTKFDDITAGLQNG